MSCATCDYEPIGRKPEGWQCGECATDKAVREILRRVNVTEPGGEWSTYDIARQLDPLAHKPRSMFDAGMPWPRDEYVEIAASAVTRIGPSARYVGGTSKYLYSLPKEEG